jgi:uncharacterized protein YodC (DUF2158 family)
MAEFQRGDMVYVRMVGGPLLTVESVWENPNNEYEVEVTCIWAENECLKWHTFHHSLLVKNEEATARRNRTKP